MQKSKSAAKGLKSDLHRKDCGSSTEITEWGKPRSVEREQVGEKDDKTLPQERVPNSALGCGKRITGRDQRLAIDENFMDRGGGAGT